MRPNFTVFLMQDKLINVLYFPHFEGHDTVQLYVHRDFTEKKMYVKKQISAEEYTKVRFDKILSSYVFHFELHWVESCQPESK